jgi:hypothetical protein
METVTSAARLLDLLGEVPSRRAVIEPQYGEYLAVEFLTNEITSDYTPLGRVEGAAYELLNDAMNADLAPDLAKTPWEQQPIRLVQTVLRDAAGLVAWVWVLPQHQQAPAAPDTAADTTGEGRQ